MVEASHTSLFKQGSFKRGLLKQAASAFLLAHAAPMGGQRQGKGELPCRHLATVSHPSSAIGSGASIPLRPSALAVEGSCVRSLALGREAAKAGGLLNKRLAAQPQSPLTKANTNPPTLVGLRPLKGSQHWTHDEPSNCFKNSLKGIVGHPLKSSSLLHYSSKNIVYSFNHSNNLYPVLTKTEYLLKSLFLSMYSLISRPIYLIRHDKVIIRLFVFLSPKADKYLDSTTIIKGGKLRGASSRIFASRSALSRRGGLAAPLPSLKGEGLAAPSNGVNPLPKAEGGLRTLEKELEQASAANTLSPLLKQAAESVPAFGTGRGRGGLAQARSARRTRSARSERYNIDKYLKIKSVRPNTVEILNSQIHSSSLNFKFIKSEFRRPPFFGYNKKKHNCTFPCFSSNPPIPPSAEGVNSVRERKRSSLALLLRWSRNISQIASPAPLHPESSYTSLVSHFQNRLEKLSTIFSKIFNKKVEFEIIKAQLPYQDSNILAQVLGYNANNYKFRRMLKILIPRAVIKNPSKEFTSAGGTAPQALLPFFKLTQPHSGVRGKGAAPFPCLSSNPPLPKAAQLSQPSLSERLNNKWAGLPNPMGKAKEAKDLNILFSCASEPSSYLPSFFYSKNYLDGIYSSLFDLSLKAKSLLDSSSLSYPLQGANSSLLAPQAREVRSLTPLRCLGQRVEQEANTKRVAAPLHVTKPEAKKLPSYLSGMNIKLAGRLMTESMRPRFTVQSHQDGSLARVKVHFTEKSRFTGKNKRGAFSFTVTISHVLN